MVKPPHKWARLGLGGARCIAPSPHVTWVRAFQGGTHKH